MVRSYLQSSCPVARALDVVGERWTMLVLRELFVHGARRYQDLQLSLTGVAPNTLSSRLKSLESNGLIRRELYSDHPPRLEYRLTEKGQSLGPVLQALREWGKKHA